MQSDIRYRGKEKYDRSTALAYKDRPRKQHAAEMSLIDRVFRHIPQAHRVLDLPCGGGRVVVHLARRGYHVTGADHSPAMVEIARHTLDENSLACPVEQQDIEALTYADRQFDTIICFRLFHHFPNAEIRQKAVSELCRVAGTYVALSYFSPLSLTSLRTRLRIALGGRGSQKLTTPLAEVQGYFRRQGFVLVKDLARRRFIHTLHVALFARRN
ncbi:MAG TPA: class I SAM-dependent methyltransferase [Candidatus Accumulibacter phosphatis]|nr:class I SAM-dependent methyltransferase [Candidatus Accumulibacter phosphatis]HRQ95479.1 class I SAM-dependent methyltransferase [Candidatus Accumulibacter phosphatis]